MSFAFPFFSSVRLWGWQENAIEVKRAEEQGNSAPGLDTSKSDMSPYMQGVAHRNSAFSQLKFSKYKANICLILIE